MSLNKACLWLLPFVVAVTSAALAQDSTNAVQASRSADAPGFKSRNTAIGLGLFPGGGHFYAGERRRAGAILGAFTVGAFLLGQPTKLEQTCDDQGQECGSGYTTASFTTWLVGFGLAFGSWLYSVGDAGTAAERANRRNGLAAPRTQPGPLLVTRRNGGTAIGLTLRTF